MPKWGAVLKQGGSTLKCFGISHVCTNPHADIWMPTEHFLVVKGMCDIELTEMKREIRSSFFPALFCLAFSWVSEKQMTFIQSLPTASELKFLSIFHLLFFLLKFLAPLFRRSWKREFLLVQRSSYVLEQRAFFVFIKQMLHFLWKQCWPFSRARAPGRHVWRPGALLTTVPRTWGCRACPHQGSFVWASPASWGKCLPAAPLTS